MHPPCNSYCGSRQPGVNIDQKPSHVLHHVRTGSKGWRCPFVDYPFRQSGLDMDQNDSQGQAARSGYGPNCQPSLVSQGWLWTKMPAMGDRQQTMVMGCVVSYPWVWHPWTKFQPWTGSNGWIWPILSGIPRHMMLTFDWTPLPVVGRKDRDE